MPSLHGHGNEFNGSIMKFRSQDGKSSRDMQELHLLLNRPESEQAQRRVSRRDGTTAALTLHCGVINSRRRSRGGGGRLHQPHRDFKTPFYRIFPKCFYLEVFYPLKGFKNQNAALIIIF